MAFSMTGKTAALRVGGRLALALADYTFATRDASAGGGWRLDGRVETKDDYWLERAAAFDLRVDLTRSSWRFRAVPRAALALAGATATITHRGEPEDA